MTLLPAVGNFFLQPVEYSVEKFEKKFGNATQIATDEAAVDDSITSLEVGDCITLFIRERVKGHIAHVFACHFDSLSNEQDIRGEVKVFLKKKDNTSYRFCIVGGNGSKDSKKCAKRIKEVAEKFLNKGYEIRSFNEYLDLNQGKPFDYIDVNIRLRKRLVFCRYNNGSFEEC